MTDYGIYPVALHDQDDLVITARRDPGGHLVIEGQDLAPAPEQFGPDAVEYVFAHLIAEADLPRLLAALGEPPDTDVLDALYRHRDVLGGKVEAWLRAHGIEYEFWSRVG